MNRDAKDAFHRLVYRHNIEFYKYYYNFIRVDLSEASKLVRYFVFSLSNLLKFTSLGWRIGRGRKNLKNLYIDILLIMEGEESGDIAGMHARFT